MKIKITGISGYLGQQLAKQLADNGHEVSGIKREMLYGDSSDLSSEIKNTDIIIHLSGSAILQRWTEKNKNKIYTSRVKTTQNLVWAIKRLSPEEYPKKIISASAIGIYKHGKLHTEESVDFEQGFIGKIVHNWEESLRNIPSPIPVIIFRMGPILGKKSKTITNMLLPFKLGFGATIGNGKQPFPFIHEKDASNAFVWAVEKYSHTDTFNLTAPEKITNKTFTKELAKQLHRPAFLSVPGLMLRLLYGKAYTILTRSPEVSVEKIMKAGFKFLFPDIKSTLKEIVG